LVFLVFETDCAVYKRRLGTVRSPWITDCAVSSQSQMIIFCQIFALPTSTQHCAFLFLQRKKQMVANGYARQSKSSLSVREIEMLCTVLDAEPGRAFHAAPHPALPFRASEYQDMSSI
jgi:hypothetical protein